jgi:hypothetical protein
MVRIDSHGKHVERALELGFLSCWFTIAPLLMVGVTPTKELALLKRQAEGVGELT